MGFIVANSLRLCAIWYDDFMGEYLVLIAFQDPLVVSLLTRHAVRIGTFFLLESIILSQKCGPMPNVMAALPNIGGALCPTPQSLADAQYWSAVQ